MPSGVRFRQRVPLPLSRYTAVRRFQGYVPPGPEALTSVRLMASFFSELTRCWRGLFSVGAGSPCLFLVFSMAFAFGCFRLCWRWFFLGSHLLQRVPPLHPVPPIIAKMALTGDVGALLGKQLGNNTVGRGFPVHGRPYRFSISSMGCPLCDGVTFLDEPFTDFFPFVIVSDPSEAFAIQLPYF